MTKNANNLLAYLKGTGAQIVMKSRYNHQFPYNLLQEYKYNVKVAQPFMVKAIIFAKVKTDKIDARMLVDLDRTGLIPEAYISDKKILNLVRHRHAFVDERTNRIKAELAKRRIDVIASLSILPGQKRLRELNNR